MEKIVKYLGHKLRTDQQLHGNILVYLKGDSIGEFYSVAITNNFQQLIQVLKMRHIGKNTKSKIISKGISLGKSQNT